MNLKELLVQEWEMEVAKTRRILEQVPADRWEWQPHPKSYRMGDLVTHLVNLPTWTQGTLEQDSFDLAPAEGGEIPRASRLRSPKEALERLEENSRAVIAALESVDNAHLMAPWTLLSGGREQFTMPRLMVLRSFVFNHQVHHRAQLGVYLRLCNIPVPGVYGPSADDK